MAEDEAFESPRKKLKLHQETDGNSAIVDSTDDYVKPGKMKQESDIFGIDLGAMGDGELPSTSEADLENGADSDADMSDLSGMSGEHAWRGPASGILSWVYQCMEKGDDPRSILQQLIPDESSIPDVSDFMLWKIIINILSEPPPRSKLKNINTLEDVVGLIRSCSNIMILTGAGVSVSCGIPDFRSRNGIYARLAVDFPDLPDPQAMFDIRYFKSDQRPFFKFAKEIYPGQFEPSKCHKFIQLIESHGKLLRNYTQNIDTLEQVAGIKNVIQCHGSFATATCMTCSYKCSSDDIKSPIMEQVIPKCPKCEPKTELSVMKPDIVFFGESLPEEFHDQMAKDKDECDLLIVIGSSLKVRPVALIPNSLPSHVPQILINKEPLRNLHFDVELLGDCEVIVSMLCRLLAEGWESLAHPVLMSEISPDLLLTPPASPNIPSTQHPEQETQTFSGPDSTSSKSTTVVTDSCDVTSDGGTATASITDTAENIVETSEAASHTVVEACEKKCKTAENFPENKPDVPESAASSSVATSSVCEAGSSTVGDSNQINSEEKSDKEQQSDEVVHEECDSTGDIVSAGQDVAGGSGDVPTGTKDSEGSKEAEFEKVVSTEELREMWKPNYTRFSVASRLGPNQYCFIPPSRYVFPEAEVYTTDMSSDSDSDTNDSDLDDFDKSKEMSDTAELDNSDLLELAADTCTTTVGGHISEMCKWNESEHTHAQVHAEHRLPQESVDVTPVVSGSDGKTEKQTEGSTSDSDCKMSADSIDGCDTRE